MAEQNEQADSTQDMGLPTPDQVKLIASVSSDESLAQTRQPAIARCIGLVILAITTFFAIQWGLSAGGMHAKLNELKATHSIEAPLDLTVEGETVIPFNHTYNSLHGLAIRLMDLPEGIDPGIVDAALNDFEGHLDITDAQGELVERVDIDFKSIFVSADYGVHLAKIRSLPIGEYTATVNVTWPAAEELGQEQVVYCEYMFCHAELLPPVITTVFAIGSGVIAMISLLCAMPGLVRHGIWKVVPTALDH